MPPYSTGLETRQRLLAVAAEVFSEQGFTHAKVSEICQKAGANAAAVNYHFGDKEQLYLEVVKWAHEQSNGCTAWQQVDPSLSPKEQLAQFILDFIENLFDPEKPTWLSRLMARELFEPTRALDYMIEKAVIPTVTKLEEIVAAVLGPAAETRLVKLCTASIMGQCVLYQNSRQIIARLNPEMAYGREGNSELAAHVTRFSLEALEGLAQGAGTSRDADGMNGRYQADREITRGK